MTEIDKAMNHLRFEFKKYLKEARQEFGKEVSKYNVSDNLQLRTACDSFLIAFDQATEKAINYTHCCTELPTSTQLLSDCKKRFKELEGKGNLDYKSYRNGYLDSFSKNVVSKISQT